MKKNNAFRRAAALMAALSITVSLAAPAFADTYYIDYGDITITKNEDGSQTIQQGTEKWTDKAGEETVITTSNTVITTLESDLEGPAAEDTGFGPVAEDNYQPAQPESTEEPKGADQPEDAEKPEGADQPKDADRQESADQQAAPAAAPAGSTPVNDKGNGFWGNTITLKTIADKVLNLTLKDVKIDVSDKGKAALSVQGKGNAEIELDGDNELKSGVNRAGLEKTSTGTLTLKDDNNKAGSLTATGGDSGAGIGGGLDGNGKNITIKGGTVTATGGRLGAGIGGGSGGYRGGDAGSGKNITITGGTVTAAGGEGGAGIGGGMNGSGNNITIKGGTVTATGGGYSAGIGGSSSGSGKNITINGGTVNAAGGTYGAGIGGGDRSNGENITINGGEINATGGKYGAGIGGGASIDDGGDGKNITINGGTVNAAGGESGAGIGGGLRGSGSNVTVSGAAQVTTTAGKRDNRFGAGATIGNGGKKTPGGELVDGDEIQAKLDDLTTGYIHHVNYNQDGTVKREWWERKWVELEPSHPTPDGVSLDLHVETLKGAPLLFNTRQQGSTLRVTTDNLSARLHGTRQALETLQEQGVEQIQFVTTLKTTTLSVAELLAEGGSWFALEHDGLVSRRLSAAQAESLKCWRH